VDGWRLRAEASGGLPNAAGVLLKGGGSRLETRATRLETLVLGRKAQNEAIIALSKQPITGRLPATGFTPFAL
jgi:hypothetical protein